MGIGYERFQQVGCNRAVDSPCRLRRFAIELEALGLWGQEHLLNIRELGMLAVRAAVPGTRLLHAS